MRLFVALRPPRAARDELASAIAALLEATPELRWIRPENWHLTLAFLGAVEQPTADRLLESLERVAVRYGPLQLSLAGAGRFGQQVLWAGIAGDREPLGRLADSVRAGARCAGIEAEARPYRGHLTLARGAPGVDLRTPVARLRGFTGSPWTAAELHLVESRLGAGPGRTAMHVTYARWPLGRRG